MELEVKVMPRAGTNEISGWREGVLIVRVAAPPAEGRANEALRKLLAKRLGVARGRVEIARGARGRRKLVRIDADPELVRSRLPAS